MSEIVLKVDGMSCNHCVSSVEKAIQQLGGTAQVELASKRVTVQYNEGSVTKEAIIQAIEDQGYDIL